MGVNTITNLEKHKFYRVELVTANIPQLLTNLERKHKFYRVELVTANISQLLPLTLVHGRGE